MVNSLFWVYLATQGINPKKHLVKQEVERIRAYMNTVKEIADKNRAAKVDKGATSRFVWNIMYETKSQKESTKKSLLAKKNKIR